jgi:hypothetical protein
LSLFHIPSWSNMTTETWVQTLLFHQISPRRRYPFELEWYPDTLVKNPQCSVVFVTFDDNDSTVQYGTTVWCGNWQLQWQKVQRVVNYDGQRSGKNSVSCWDIVPDSPQGSPDDQQSPRSGLQSQPIRSTIRFHSMMWTVTITIRKRLRNGKKTPCPRQSPTPRIKDPKVYTTYPMPKDELDGQPIIGKVPPDPRGPGQTRTLFKFRQPADFFHTLKTVRRLIHIVPSRTPRSSGYGVLFTCGLCYILFLLYVYLRDLLRKYWQCSDI